MEYLCTISNGIDNEYIKLFKCHNHIILNKYNDIRYSKIKNVLLENNHIESYFNINNNLHYYKEYNYQNYNDIVNCIIERDFEINKLLPKHRSLERKLNFDKKYYHNPIIFYLNDNYTTKQNIHRKR